MNKLILLLALVGMTYTLAPTIAEEKDLFMQFQQFVETYQKKYSSQEEFMARYEVFKMNLMGLRSTRVSHEVGVTKFSDLTKEEFKQQYLTMQIPSTSPIVINYIPKGNAPESFDWREKGVVNPVKDQRLCGSCWAYSSVANIEGLYSIKYGELLKFSEQHLIDCDLYDSGCGGGWMEMAFRWLINNYGLLLEEDYPWSGGQGHCEPKIERAKAFLSGYNLLNTTDEEVIKEFLVQTGPLAVAMNADGLQNYKSGILDYDANMCPTEMKNLNHAVNLVGYGIEENEEGQRVEYWIVRNSWFNDWGEDGYFRLALGNGVCGINTYVITAILK